MKRFIAVMVLLVGIGSGVKAQTNLQAFYDFGKDRHIITTTLEGFYGDKWGNTFFFVDYDYQLKDAAGNKAPDGTYFELARCLNFWQDTDLAPLSLQVEYNGGVYSKYGINHAFLAGLDWFVHSSDFKNTFNFKVLYKGIVYDDKSMHSKVPMQLTFVWGMDDLFGLKGLKFTGFADFWWQEHSVAPYENGVYNWLKAENKSTVFISEPQLWYNIGRNFGCDNLNIGGEVEISYDFGSSKGFWARPCAGIKWVF